MQTPWVSPQSRTLRRPYNNLSKLAISPGPWQACHNYWLLMLFYSLTFSMEHSPKFSPQKIKKLYFFLPFFWCVCVYCMILSMSSSRTGKTSRWEQKSEQRLHLAQPCLPLCDPVDCSPPGSSVHGISQARILEGVAISFSRGSSRPRDQTCISCIGRRALYQQCRLGALAPPWEGTEEKRGENL